MGFGTSYSIGYVDPFEWVHTKFLKRLARGLIGVSIVIGLDTLIKLIEIEDQSTVFILQKAFPALLFSLFTYGWVPIICQKIGLVDRETKIDN